MTSDELLFPFVDDDDSATIQTERKKEKIRVKEVLLCWLVMETQATAD